MKKAVELKNARERRAKLLAEYTAGKVTQATLATKYGVTYQRIGQLLAKARKQVRQ